MVDLKLFFVLVDGAFSLIFIPFHLRNPSLSSYLFNPINQPTLIINMQFAANKFQEYKGPEPGSEVEPNYAHRPDGEKMRALAWFG
jgi:hypothetical protein